MLTDLIRTEHIARNVPAADWESAVRYAGDLLVRTGSIEPRYIDRMVEICKESGPYIVIVPGVALAHARPDDGVNQVCLSLVTLARPVAFGSADNDPVRVVVALATVDSSAHLSALRDLVQFISHSRNIDELCVCPSNGAVLELFRRFEACSAAG